MLTMSLILLITNTISYLINLVKFVSGVGIWVPELLLASCMGVARSKRHLGKEFPSQ